MRNSDTTDDPFGFDDAIKNIERSRIGFPFFLAVALLFFSWRYGAPFIPDELSTGEVMTLVLLLAILFLHEALARFTLLYLRNERRKHKLGR